MMHISTGSYVSTTNARDYQCIDPLTNGENFLISKDQIERLGIEAECSITVNGIPQATFRNTIKYELLEIIDALKEDTAYFNNKGKLTWRVNKKEREKKKKEKSLGHVYFFKSAGLFKVGKSRKDQIHTRIKAQKPDEILFVSAETTKYGELERTIHREFQKKRMGAYEIFTDLTKDDISKIKAMMTTASKDPHASTLKTQEVKTKYREWRKQQSQ